MALKHHIDAQLRYNQQVENSTAYVLPFLENTQAIDSQTKVLEVGTGEGGVLVPFIQRGCYCVGVDLAQARIDIANAMLESEVSSGKVEFLCINIYDSLFINRFKHEFDIIILKDVIEHVPNQKDFIAHLKLFLKSGGQIFFGFPPWYMPFGGHQQTCQTKLASKLPYYHILPKFIYIALLKAFGENEGTIRELIEIKDTQISIERFERIIMQNKLSILHKQHYLINPIYKYKFGLNPRKQWRPITWIPYVRDFVTTCVYYTVG